MARVTACWVAAALACASCSPSPPKNADDAVHEGETPPAPPPQAEETPPPTPSTSGSSGTGVPYDKYETEVVLKRAARQANANCGAATDDDGKKTGPWGKTTVTVTLGHNGHSEGATVPAPFDGKPVGKCIVRAFSILIFPPFPGQNTNVDWDLDIAKPPGAE